MTVKCWKADVATDLSHPYTAADFSGQSRCLVILALILTFLVIISIIIGVVSLIDLRERGQFHRPDSMQMGDKPGGKVR